MRTTRILMIPGLMSALALGACNTNPSSESDVTAEPLAQAVRVDLSKAPDAQRGSATAGERDLGLSADDDLNLLKTTSGPRGMSYTREQQTYKGVPIWGEHVITAYDANGNVVRMAGHVLQGLEKTGLDMRPELSADEALASMKELRFAGHVGPAMQFENEKSDLVIYARDGKVALAYEVSFFADSAKGSHPTRPVYLVDAHTGGVLFHYEGLTHANATGPGGNNKTGQYNYGTDFPFLNVAFNGSTSTMNNTDVKTVNLNHGTSGSTAFSFSGTNNTVKQINGAFSPLNDAHHFGGVVFNMYNAYVGVPPLSFQLMMRVHYSTNYQNAFWNGSSMTFGDGASTFYPLVSLDVSAHEVSHGFTEQNSGLIYSGQSGGINEAYSDISGEAAEFFNQGSNDFWVGAEIYKASGQALRYMDNPPQDGNSIDHTSNYFSGMDVHYSSGVFNKAFYNLATTAGWNTQSAFLVFARANQNYWGPSTNFEQGGDGVFNAACDEGLDTADVVAAFSPVGVNITLSCGAPTCGNGICEPGEDNSNCPADCPPTGCQWQLGDYNYCRDCGPCSDGEGDCDNDAECAAGTTCVHNIGSQYGWPADVDVCESSSSDPNSCIDSNACGTQAPGGCWCDSLCTFYGDCCFDGPC